MGWNTIHAKRSDRYIAVKCFRGSVGIDAGITYPDRRLFSADLEPQEAGALGIALIEAVEEIFPEVMDEKLLGMLRALDDEERTILFSKFCVHCGDANPPCQCTNDE